MAYVFEWDASKAEANARKHGVTFEDATTVFGDPLGLMMPDPDHSGDEGRYLLLGQSKQGKLLVVALAERPHHTRIISARLATHRERAHYEEN